MYSFGDTVKECSETENNFIAEMISRKDKIMNRYDYYTRCVNFDEQEWLTEELYYPECDDDIWSNDRRPSYEECCPGIEDYLEGRVITGGEAGNSRKKAGGGSGNKNISMESDGIEA